MALSLVMAAFRRAKAHIPVETAQLKDRRWTILVCLTWQYVHGICGKAAHYWHRPAPLLADAGFALVPELGKSNFFVSEVLTAVLFASFFLWVLAPFYMTHRRYYTVVVLHRALLVLATCQCLRVLSFLSTALPGPNYHCREGSPLATLPRPRAWAEVLLLDVARQSGRGCGDLIFSSHTTFALVFVLSYQRYGSNKAVKRLAWLTALTLSVLIVASRKHYTVDVVVAWYTVVLVFACVDRHFVDAADKPPPQSTTCCFEDVLPCCVGARAPDMLRIAPATPQASEMAKARPDYDEERGLLERNMSR